MTTEPPTSDPCPLILDTDCCGETLQGVGTSWGVKWENPISSVVILQQLSSFNQIQAVKQKLFDLDCFLLVDKLGS